MKMSDGSNCELEVVAYDDGSLYIGVRNVARSRIRSLAFDASTDFTEFANELNQIEGFTASFEKPVPRISAPRNVGAVVEFQKVRYVRDGFNDYYPWSRFGRPSEYPDHWYGFNDQPETDLKILSQGYVEKD